MKSILFFVLGSIFIEIVEAVTDCQ